MDIVQAFTNKRFDEEHKARGVNPISIGDQNNGLGSVYGLRSIGNRSGRRGLGGLNIVAFFWFNFTVINVVVIIVFVVVVVAVFFA